MGGSNEDVIRAVLQSWGEGVDAANPEEVAELFNSMGAIGFVSVDVGFRNIVSAGDVVCTERVDWLVRPDGSRLGPLPIVGVTEFRDGKISSWREYFDRTHLTRAAGTTD